ncbi:hypothetical protein Leryth_005678 [Lithospermum erythrorhizon]|nr:hypothetical protein Leryth_005678 [Lithospermum erythrorhizon]
MLKGGSSVCINSDVLVVHMFYNVRNANTEFSGSLSALINVGLSRLTFLRLRRLTTKECTHLQQSYTARRKGQHCCMRDANTSRLVEIRREREPLFSKWLYNKKFIREKCISQARSRQVAQLNFGVSRRFESLPGGILTTSHRQAGHFESIR